METKPVTETTTAEREMSLLEEILADVQAAGKDTRALPQDQRSALLVGLARKLGLNPLSGAVMFLNTNGKETLYVTKQGTDQIAAREKLNRETIKGPEVIEINKRLIVICQVRATHPDGRSEVSTGTLALADPVNDLMKCETKAKRRATLSVCGLGLLAEDEIETIPGASSVPFEPPAPSARDLFFKAVEGARGLRAVGALWQKHSAALHTAGAAGTVTGRLGADLRARGYDLVASEVQLLCTGTLTAGLCTYLDGLSASESADDARTYYVACAIDLAGLDAREATIARRNTERTVQAWNECSEADAKAFLAPREPGDESEPLDPDAVVLTLESFLRRIETIELPGEAVAVWMKFRGQIASFTVPEREEAWKALTTRTEEVGKMKNAKVWLKKAIAEEDARRVTGSDNGPTDDPPAGGGAPGGVPSNGNATGTSAPASAGAGARAQLAAVPFTAGDAASERAYLATKTHPVALANALRAHGRHLSPAGVVAAEERVVCLSYDPSGHATPTPAEARAYVAKLITEGPRPKVSTAKRAVA